VFSGGSALTFCFGFAVVRDYTFDGNAFYVLFQKVSGLGSIMVDV